VLEHVESFIGLLCQRLGVEYGGYHTLSVGVLDREKCPNIAFHVGTNRHLRIQPATVDIFEGSGVVFEALVGTKRTVVKGDRGTTVGEFSDLTNKQLFPEA
jgi:hypothetical protein